MTHFYQYEWSAITVCCGCTWCSLAAGSGSGKNPDQIHALVKHSEESDPSKPGWSLVDADLAMQRLGVPFDNRSGDGWAALVAAHDAGLDVVVQGDSDQFGNGTCSGAFDGDHCINIRAEEDAAGYWLIDDSICRKPRFEKPATIHAYARKLDPGIRFGVFTRPTEEAMRLTKIRTTPGTAVLSEAHGLWRVATDNKTGDQPKGTVFKVGTTVNYHQAENGGKGFDGYLVELVPAGEAYILPAPFSAFTPAAAPSDCKSEVASAITADRASARITYP